MGLDIFVDTVIASIHVPISRMSFQNTSFVDGSGEEVEMNSTESLSSLLPCLSENVTDSYRLGSPILSKIHNGGLVTIVVLFMLAMGCDMKLSQVKSHIRRPVGVIIGMVCQFGIMPLYGFGLVQVLGIHGFFGTGILLVSCCPGGSISNILTYLLDGEIALSVTMTTLSTAIALGMMPFNMWLYGHGIETGDIVIPYGGISFSLLLITAPVAVGMVINWKLPKISPYITKVGGTAGLVIILGLGIMEVVLYHKLYMMAPWPIYVACFSLIPLGYVTGYCIMWIFKHESKLRRTVGIECGIQNAALATTIASLSFEHPGQLQVRLFPVVYSLAQAVVGFLAAGVFRAMSFTQDNEFKDKTSIGKMKQVQYLSDVEKRFTKGEEVAPLAQT